MLDGVTLLEKLLSYLHEGFQAPGHILRYLQARHKCFDGDCKTKGCERLIQHFPDTRTWNRDSLDEFFKWSRQWYKPNTESYEEPINAVFTLPRIAQFLEQEMGFEQSEISETFKMEFKGGGKCKDFVPPCLWKGKEKEPTSCGGMCCDFYLRDRKGRFPITVGEIKVAVPPQSGNIFGGFLKDVEKCKEWLKPETGKYVNDKFKIERFDYALAILIDLTGDNEYFNLWKKSGINEHDCLEENIFVRHIHVGKF